MLSAIWHRKHKSLKQIAIQLFEPVHFSLIIQELFLLVMDNN